MNDLIKIYNFQLEANEAKILGPNNSHLNIMEELFACEIIIKQANVYVNIFYQEQKEKIIALLSFLEKMISSNQTFSVREIIVIHQSIIDGNLSELEKIYFQKEILLTLNNGKVIFPKTINQAFYIKELNNNDIVFAVGPAGTGKTYLAVLYAVALLKKQIIKKIVLVRPVVEAGEKLGFLPGDLKEKIDPYLVPLYDALEECFGKENVKKMLDKGLIEIVPLAYMRGRTLDNSVIILDEAQNATAMQMKMFLTRLGFNSKMIVTGDLTQIDLLNKNNSGLAEVLSLLQNIKGISFVKFDSSDVMRHPLVFKIINRYESMK